MKCAHANRETLTVEAKLPAGWTRSTTFHRCADCGLGLGIRSYQAAFMTDNVPRREGEWMADALAGNAGVMGTLKENDRA